MNQRLKTTRIRVDSGLTWVVEPFTWGFGRFGKIMKRMLVILSRVLVVALVILALFLNNSAVRWVYVSSAPTATTGVELLITVILCLSVSLWAAFVDKEANRWEGVLVLVGLIFGSLLSLYSYVSERFSLDWMMETQQTPASINNVSIVVDCLLAITIILGLAAIAVFSLILRRKSIGASELTAIAVVALIVTVVALLSPLL